MITLSHDKNEIKSILQADAYIKKLGFKPTGIKVTGAGTDIINASVSDKQIFISSGPPIKTYSTIVKNLIYKVLVSAGRNESNKVDCAVEQIIGLLEGKEIGNGHVLYVEDAPEEMYSPSTLYIVETTFLCQSTIFNVVKK